MIPYLLLAGALFIGFRAIKVHRASAYDVRPKDGERLLPEDQWYEPVYGQSLNSDGSIPVYAPLTEIPVSSTSSVVNRNPYNGTLSDLAESKRVDAFNSLNVQFSLDF